MVKHSIVLVALVLVVPLLPRTLGAETPQSKELSAKSAMSDEVLLEITRKGAGMIFPLQKQLFFRLYMNGRLEFEVPPVFDPKAERATFDLVLRQTRLSLKDVNEIMRLAEQASFLNAADEYAALEREIDAVMVTRVSYTHHDKKKQILITNFRPEHPRASSHYPASLRELLGKVVEMRPKTDDEIRYKWGTIY